MGPDHRQEAAAEETTVEAAEAAEESAAQTGKPTTEAAGMTGRLVRRRPHGRPRSLLMSALRRWRMRREWTGPGRRGPKSGQPPHRLF